MQEQVKPTNDCTLSLVVVDAPSPIEPDPPVCAAPVKALRRPNGTLLPGQPTINRKGRPRSPWRELAEKAIPVTVFTKIVKKVCEQAMAGDPKAQKLILDKTLGNQVDIQTNFSPIFAQVIERMQQVNIEDYK